MPRPYTLLLIALTVALFTLATVGSAMAASGTLPPGGSVCDGPFFADGSSVSAVELTGHADGVVKWSIHQSADPVFANSHKVFKHHATDIDAFVFASSNPELFPGFFWGCAFNDGTTTVNVSDVSIGPPLN